MSRRGDLVLIESLPQLLGGHDRCAQYQAVRAVSRVRTTAVLVKQANRQPDRLGREPRGNSHQVPSSTRWPQLGAGDDTTSVHGTAGEVVSRASQALLAVRFRRVKLQRE